MQQACLFCSGGRIARMACILCLALASAALLGLVGEAASPPIHFLTWPSRLAYALVGILEGVPPS